MNENWLFQVKKEDKNFKKDANHVRGFGTQAGRFKEGWRFVSKSEINSINKKSWFCIKFV